MGRCTIFVESCLRRIDTYIEEIYGIKCRVQDRFIILDSNDIEDILSIFRDTILNRYINRVFLLDRKTNDLSEIIQEASEYCPLRVQAYPKETPIRFVKNIRKERCKSLSNKIQIHFICFCTR